MGVLPGGRRSLRAALPALAALVLLAGCLAPGPGAGSAPPRGPPAAEDAHPSPPLAAAVPGAPVVVAVLDSGINPYHVAFRDPSARAHPATFLDQYPREARALELTLDAAQLEDALAADRAAWDAAERGSLYWIPGTRVVAAISFGEFTEAEDPRPIRDDFLHGTATAGAVLDAAPQALLVVVETSPLLGEALAWAVEQPWIDVLSISVGALGNLPTNVLTPEVAELTRAAVERGMLVVFAAGNDPTLSAADGHDGPPWVLSVGGAARDARGEVAVASKGTDVVGEYRQATVSHRSLDERVVRSGTSFAAPGVAGTLAAALQELRRDAGQRHGRGGGALVQAPAAGGLLDDGALTNGELREALNATAAYWSPAEWRPRAPAVEPADARATLADLLAETVPVGPAPWVQMGWGFVGLDLAGTLAEAARSGELPPKPEAARAHMDALQRARCAAWC